MKQGIWFFILLGGLVACARGSDDPDGDEGGPVAGNDASPEAGLPAGDGGRPARDAAPPDGASPVQSSPDDDTGAPLLDDAGSPEDAPAAADAGEATDAIAPDASLSDAPLSDATAADADVAPTGTGYTWQSMTSATANTGRLAAPAVNDGSLVTQVDIDNSSGDDANAWEAGGVVFPSAIDVASVVFVQGTTGSQSTGDGWFEANFGLQFSPDGTAWAAASGWSVSPNYAYSSGVSGKTFTFSGVAVSGVRGVRVVGQVNTVGKSWWEAVNEVMVYEP
jgi:hypothetical protein